MTADDIRTAAAVASAVIALTALGVAIWAATSARRSAKNSGVSAKAAGDSLAMLRRQKHDDLKPTKPAVIQTELRRTVAADGSAFGSITVDRDYRVRAERVFRGGSTNQLGLPLVLRANEVHEFEVEHMPPDREHLEVTEIRFRFWPPNESDPVEHWTCPCGEPTNDEEGPGHWFWSVPVNPPKPEQKAWAAYA